MDLNNYSIDALKIREKISPSGVFVKANFFCIMKKSNFLHKRSEKKALLFHSVSFPYVNVELLLEFKSTLLFAECIE